MRRCRDDCNTNVAFKCSWLKKYPALREFDEKHVFFRGLMTSIGKHLRHRATWRKVVRSVRTASVSMFDIGSDIFSIIVYRSKGLNDVADMMAAFVLLSVGLQLLASVTIHHESKKRLLVEIISTLTFTKAGFNKYRVLTDAKPEGHEIVTPVTEMLAFKLAEMFAESIPMVSTTVRPKIRLQLSRY